MTEHNVSSTGTEGNSGTVPATPGFYACTWVSPCRPQPLRTVNYYDAQGWRYSAPASWAGTDPSELEVKAEAPHTWEPVQAGDVEVDPFASLSTGLQLTLRDDCDRTRDQLAALRLLLARAHESVAALGEGAVLTLRELAGDLEDRHAELREALCGSLTAA